MKALGNSVAVERDEPLFGHVDHALNFFGHGCCNKGIDRCSDWSFRMIGPVSDVQCWCGVFIRSIHIKDKTKFRSFGAALKSSAAMIIGDSDDFKFH